MSRWRDLNRMKDCNEAHCGLPAGFFRVNYFHGKEMRLADYVDDQRYHAGKMRFHNGKLHGAGILCGLKLGVLQPEGTILRVARGAAIDACGREVLVGFDQCVDVAAWFRQQAYEFQDQDDNPCTPDERNRVKLCVVMRYAECGGSPEPVPANPCGPPDACGCDGGGGSPCATCYPCQQEAQFGRTTEEFELRLMFADEAKAASQDPLFPTKAQIDAAAAFGGIGLLSALTPSIRESCPCPETEWLLLGCFDVIVERQKPEEVVAIEDIDYTCASQVLLSTEVVQYLLAGLYDEVGPDIGGPEITAIDFEKTGENAYRFTLSLSAEIEAQSLDAERNFGLRQLTASGWDVPAGEAVKATYSTTGDVAFGGPVIRIDIDNHTDFLRDGARYQLFAMEDTSPVVDALLRRLRPRHLSYRFCLSAPSGGGDLTLQPLGA